MDSTIEHAVRFSGMSARCERQRSARARAASVALVDASAHALVVRCVCIEGAELGWRAAWTLQWRAACLVDEGKTLATRLVSARLPRPLATPPTIRLPLFSSF